MQLQFDPLLLIRTFLSLSILFLVDYYTIVTDLKEQIKWISSR